MLPENALLDNGLATIGAILWSVQVIPQIIKSHQTKSTEGLSPHLMLIWATACLFEGAYLVAMRSSLPLQLQPQCFGLLGAVSWAQCLYYSYGFSKRKAITYLVSFWAIFAGFEAASVFTLWHLQAKGITWPLPMYGYITTVLLAMGLLPQYYEIWVHKEVFGISMGFMLIDIAGGVFSAASLFFHNPFDYIACVQFMLVVVLDGLVVVLALILNPIAERRRAAEDKDDDLEAGAPEVSQPPEAQHLLGGSSSFSRYGAAEGMPAPGRRVSVAAVPHFGSVHNHSHMPQRKNSTQGQN
ncbi:hypothetical protein VHUM_03299 [Vanrija humicola]|uniref:Uncharacterized protein n=1 Tax=Vanrija humicola TaxID=5417 RepID=A0A7D8V057_VANHU|nr:hypothetical protein VHUM_03299 [Vanrija humicola]